MGYVHGNINSKNVLLSPAGHLVIANFGMSCQLAPGEMADEPRGTPGYIAPEVIANGLFGDRGWNHKADVWSMGIVLLQLYSNLAVSPYGHTPDTSTRLVVLVTDPAVLLDEIRTRNPPVYHLLSKVSRTVPYLDLG